MGWQIYSILERFIKAGPTGGTSEEDQHRHITVKMIDINIETPPDVDPSLFGRPRATGYRSSRDSDTSILDPKMLTSFIANDMGGLLRGGDHEWFWYGTILYEHVDTIVIKHDGEEFRRYDVAEKLKAVAGFREHHISTERLAEYKKATWEKRRERGLKVLED